MEWHDTMSVNILSFIYNDDLRLRQMLIYSGLERKIRAF